MPRSTKNYNEHHRTIILFFRNVEPVAGGTRSAELGIWACWLANKIRATADHKEAITIC